MISGSLKKGRKLKNIFLTLNENGNTIYQYPWDRAKVVLRGKFIATYA
jgi:hypothetical protein